MEKQREAERDGQIKRLGMEKPRDGQIKRVEIEKQREMGRLTE